MTTTADTMGCDFCSANARPSWSYPTEDFEMVPGHISTGAWLACDKCARLIESGSWHLLARRAGRETGGGQQATRAAFALHSLWREHKTGPRQAWG